MLRPTTTATHRFTRCLLLLLLLACLPALVCGQDAAPERKDVIVLLDPSLKGIAPTLSDSFDRFQFRGVLTVNDDELGPLATKANIVVGNKKTVKDWMYLLEIGKPAPRRGGALRGLEVVIPYALHYRAKPDDKPVTIVGGSLLTTGDTAEQAIFMFAKSGFSSSLSADISTRLGAAMQTGKFITQSNFPLTPKVWYPGVLVDDGATLKVTLKNKHPITVCYSLTICADPRDTREAIYPGTGGGPLYLGAGEEKEILIPVANLHDVTPNYVASYANLVDERVTIKDPSAEALADRAEKIRKRAIGRDRSKRGKRE